MIRCMQKYSKNAVLHSLEKGLYLINLRAARGKSGSNDANAEYLAKIQKGNG